VDELGMLLQTRFHCPKHSKKKKEKKKKIRLKCGEGDSRLIFGVRDERGRQNE
jgi:mRNA-degrading endonuclease RelE of RelBE toxin-antitoxin system